MTEILSYIIVSVVTAFITWLFQRLLTRREKKKQDLEIINQSVDPLLESQKKILEQNENLIRKLAEKEESQMSIQHENQLLKKQVNQLTFKIKELEGKIDELITKIDCYEKTK